MSDTHNGWANYETWNVALWIGNDEELYNLALDAKPDHDGEPHKRFASMMRELMDSTETPDGVAWNDSGLDIEALDEMMEEL